MEKTRLLIVDDLSKVREGLRMILELQDDMEIVGEASTGIEGVELAEALHPDVVITDLEMPGQDGIVTTEQIKRQGFAQSVIILTIHTSDTLRERAATAGADAYIEKSAGIDHLIQTIRAIKKRA